MLIITNEKLIRRNTRIARTCVISGMIVLVGGFFVSIKFPEQQYIVIFALIIGFFLSQVGIFFTNRWARQPRSDQATALRAGGPVDFVFKRGDFPRQ